MKFQKQMKLKNIKVGSSTYNILQQLKKDLSKRIGRFVTYSEVIEAIPKDLFSDKNTNTK